MTSKHWVLLAAVVAIAAFLRAHNLQAWALNNDEIAEVRWSSGTLPDVLKEVRRDAVHPPLDYLIQHVVGKFPLPEWARRVPSVLAGVITVFCFALLGTWWHSPRAGLFASFLVAISPIHVRYSQEVRPYATALALVAMALVALELHAITRRRGWAIGWFVLVLLAAWTLYLGGLVAGVASLVRILLERDDRLRVLFRRMPLIAAGWIVLYAPWLGVVLSVARGPRPAGPEALNRWWWEHRLHSFSTGPEVFATMTLGSWAFWLLVVIGLIVSVRARLLRTATAWLLAGGAMTLIILYLRPHYPGTVRYLLPAAIAATLLAGSALAALTRRAAPGAVGVVLLGLCAGFSALTLFEYYDDGRPDWRAVAEYVHERAKPGDTILLANSWVVRNMGFYWMQLPHRPDVSIERFLPRAAEVDGPVWIVTGQCRVREPLQAARLWRFHRATNVSEVRYVPRGERLSIAEELCPE
ncbi:MAG TPA: glycosyltransferase family 39 protein [Thermoanaerobaculia bacterium]|nr:glycosyltransferase family 39 protein [Thermoanaerobaculia bacterium]